MTDLGATLQELLERGHTNILLNLHRVNFMDSEGFGALVTWKKKLGASGGDLKLLKPIKRIQELLGLTHLNEIFEIHDDEQAALSSFLK